MEWRKQEVYAAGDDVAPKCCDQLTRAAVTDSDVGADGDLATTRAARQAGRRSSNVALRRGIRRRLRWARRGWRVIPMPVKALVCSRASLRCVPPSSKRGSITIALPATEAAATSRSSLPSSMRA